MKPKAIITNWVHPEVSDYLAHHCEVITNMDRDQPFTRERIIEEGPDAAAILTFMPDCVNEALLSELPDLRIVSCALKGYDNFDVEACTRHDVWVSIVPNLLTVPTAELTIGLIISLARNFLSADRFVRSGQFAGWRARFYGTGLANSTVAIIGMGAVGQAVAQRRSGCDAERLYVDKHALPGEQEEAMMVRHASLDAALAQGDFIVLALPLSSETVGFFNSARVGRMKHGSYLINPGRGSLVDEEAVADALAAKHLAGYAADVF